MYIVNLLLLCFFFLQCIQALGLRGTHCKWILLGQ